MASQLLSEYKQQIESLQLIPASGGCFELTADEDLIYSKLESGEFPEEPDMVKAIGERLSTAT